MKTERRGWLCWMIGLVGFVVLGLWVRIGTGAEIPEAAPQDLQKLLQESKWREALRVYDRLYQPQGGKQDFKSLNLICRGLLEEAVKSESEFDRIYAAGALVEQEDYSYLAPLEEARLSADPLERISAYQELIEVSEQLGRHSAITPLLKQALGDKDDVVRIQLLESLKQMENKDPSLLPFLEELLEDESPVVRAAVMEILGEMAPPSVLTSLEKALKDSNPYVRVTAMVSLVQRGKTAHLQQLVQAAADKKDSGVRERAVGLMGRLKHGSIRPLLRERLKEEPDPGAKITIAASLGELGDKAGLPLLEESLRGPNPLIRLSVVKALHRAYQPFFLPLLKQAVRDEDPSVRIFALFSLGESKDSSTLPLISQALEDPDPDVRMSAAQILGKLGGLDHIAPLRKALHDEDPGVVVFASRALRRILTPKNVENT